MLERAERKQHAGRIAELSAQLAVPPFPAALSHLWRYYWRLRRRKAGGMNGPAPVEWPDIEAFVSRAKVILPPWEVELIEKLDDLYLASVAEQQARDNSPDNASPDDSDAVRHVISRGQNHRRVSRRGDDP